MNYRKRNISALAGYFASGCKNEKLLGLELEHFVVDKQTRRSLHYEKGVDLLLTRLQPLYGTPILSQEHIIGISGKDASITLEPAAQLEISIKPLHNISEIARIYDEFINILTPILDDMDCELVCAGYHPKSKADELPLIPKSRYKYMDTHFKSTGTRGKYMMKGTAATQVSIDYSGEADFSKKYRVASILSPLFSLICDNTHVFEGQPFTGKMVRTYIWNDVDPGRSMIVRGALDGDFGFNDYAAYVYGTSPIFLLDGDDVIYTGSKSNAELFADRLMMPEDIEHVASMVFPDVRLKKCIEIRMADSMPIDSVIDYLSLLKGIFYNESNLNSIYQQTLGVGNSEVEAAKEELMVKGADAMIYGKSAEEWISNLKLNHYRAAAGCS